MVLDAIGPFNPEWMSELGLERYDTQARDLKARLVQRADAAMSAAAAKLRAARLKERDERVREDLEWLVSLDLAKQAAAAAPARPPAVPERYRWPAGLDRKRAR